MVVRVWKWKQLHNDNGTEVRISQVRVTEYKKLLLTLIIISIVKCKTVMFKHTKKTMH